MGEILDAKPKLIEMADLHAFLARLFQAKGLNATDARIVADVLMWAEARGTESHGLSRIPQYVSLIDEGQINPSAAPVVDADLGAACILNGHACAGPVAMMRALDLATERADKFGIGMTVIGRTTHTGAIGCYAEKAARQGLAGIVLSAGPPIMAYHGARVSSVPTAPIAIGIPGGPGGATVLDMASSVVANGRLKLAQEAGEPLPEGWALDKNGASTTDPRAAVTPLPLGGPKGAGLALMFESLSGILAGSSVLADMIGPGGRRLHRHNAVVIAIAVDRFRPVAEFRSDLDRLAAALKALPRQDGHDEIRLPGERGARAALERQTGGIPLAGKTWRQLASIGEGLGIGLPLSR